MFIRFAVVIPIMALCLAASFHRLGARFPAMLGSVAGISAGLGIITMIVMAAPPGSYLYYAGLLLVCSAMLLVRRAFYALAEVEVARSRRLGRPVSAVMLDIDHFKQINDTHGHAAGDQVLQLVAATLRTQLRPTDSFRIGDRLRGAILEASLTAGPDPIEVTASAGSATLVIESAAGLEDLLRRADGALYGAKRAGRNVVLAA